MAVGVAVVLAHRIEPFGDRPRPKRRIDLLAAFGDVSDVELLVLAKRLERFSERLLGRFGRSGNLGADARSLRLRPSQNCPFQPFWIDRTAKDVLAAEGGGLNARMMCVSRHKEDEGQRRAAHIAQGRADLAHRVHIVEIDIEENRLPAHPLQIYRHTEIDRFHTQNIGQHRRNVGTALPIVGHQQNRWLRH